MFLFYETGIFKRGSEVANDASLEAGPKMRDTNDRRNGKEG
jgi:hypothetical protein